MKQITKQSILFILSLILFVGSGFVLGRYTFPLQEKEIEKEIEKEVVYLDDEMEKCRLAGGEYFLYEIDLDWQRKYHIYCEMPAKRLFDYYIDINGKRH